MAVHHAGTAGGGGGRGGGAPNWGAVLVVLGRGSSLLGRGGRKGLEKAVASVFNEWGGGHCWELDKHFLKPTSTKPVGGWKRRVNKLQ